MCHPTRRLAAYLLAGCLLAPVPSLAAQQTQSFGSWIPDQGRVFWLRADQGASLNLGRIVPQWSEAAGGPLSVTQSDGSHMPLHERHLVNGLPALHFDGNDVLSRVDGMPTGDYTKVAVVVLDDYDANNNVLSGATEHALFFGQSDRLQLYHSGTFVTSSVPTPLGVPTVIAATFNATTGEGRLYQNGQLVGTGFGSPHSDPAIQVGGFAGINNLRGSVPEVLIYDRVLKPSQLNWIQSILGNRYRSRRGPTVQFTKLPRHGQVIQRDLFDSATIAVEGEVDSPGFETIELQVLKDGQPWLIESRPLNYVSSSAAFTFAPTVVAGLHNYQITLTLVRGSRETVVREIDNIACGDTFLVHGQSNAVAADFFGENLANQSQSPWIRSFGTATYGAGVELDLHWDIADGEGYNSHAAVGAWALRTAEVLQGQELVPIALINAAVGGTVIASHLRNDANRADLNTLYGRLLYRAQEAGIDGSARSMLWHQGESDGEAVVQYALDFDVLYDAWHEDYPALEKIYLFQIRKGCGITGAGVREFHRTAPDLYPDIEVMSTTAAPFHDGCHFFYAGYRELGERVARLMARDLYGSADTQEIDPPNILDAEFVGTSNDQILLTFRDPDDGLVWETGSEAYFLFDDATTVVSGSVTGNTILLQLAGPSTATTISYDGHPSNGPWVMNARGVGALTFFDFPIAP